MAADRSAEDCAGRSDPTGEDVGMSVNEFPQRTSSPGNGAEDHSLNPIVARTTAFSAWTRFNRRTRDNGPRGMPWTIT